MSSRLVFSPVAAKGLSSTTALTRGASLLASSSSSSSSMRSFSTRCGPPNAHRSAILTFPPATRSQLLSIPPTSSSSLARRQNSTLSERSSSEPPYKQRELPPLPSRRAPVIGMIIFALVSWTAFTLYATNLERLSSTAFKGCLSSVKDDERVQALVGEIVRVDQKWYLGGNPWVDGKISMMQGKVDLSFRVKGEKGAATIYFTALRRSQHDNFEVLRFFAVSDQGERISLLD